MGILQKITLAQPVQVCRQLNAENTTRERDGLLDAMAFFNFDRGLIITFDQEDKVIVEGKTIEVMPFWRVFG